MNKEKLYITNLDCQIHHLLKLKGIHKICCKVEKCIMYNVYKLPKHH